METELAVPHATQAGLFWKQVAVSFWRVGNTINLWALGFHPLYTLLFLPSLHPQALRALLPLSSPFKLSQG